VAIPSNGAAAWPDHESLRCDHRSHGPHGFDVFWVAVHCDLAEIDRREVARFLVGAA
jgi:hypothetical protein